MFRKNRKYCLFIIFFYWAIFRDFLETISAVFSYIDELAVFAGILLWVIQMKKNDWKIKITQNRYKCWILSMILIGLISYGWHPYQKPLPAIKDLISCVKFWFALYVGKCVFDTNLLKDYGKQIFFHIRNVLYFLSVLTVLDEVFHLFFSEIRYGLRSVQLFYSHTTILAGVCIFLLAMLIFVREQAEHFYVYFFINIALLCLTLRSKAIVGAFAGLLIYYVTVMRNKKINIRRILLFVPCAIFIARNQIEFYFFSGIKDDSARNRLLLSSFKIAKDFFPFGTGFATFGSAASGEYYSPIYSMYHISHVNGLRPGAAHFVSDSFWPMILGQFGCFGLLFMVLAIIEVFRLVQCLKKQNRYYYAGSLVILSYLMIVSLAESAFVHPGSVPLAVLLGIITNYKQTRRT